MRFPRFYALTVLVLLSVGAIVLTKSSSFKAVSNSDKVVVTNKTRAFQVIDAKRADETFTLALKNNYDRRITAFVITVGSSFRITEDFATSEVSDDVGIPSQETFERTYPLSSSVGPSLNITLQSVVFDDKSGDGDPVIFEDIRDTRLGQAVQINRALKLIEKHLNSHDSNNTSKLKNDIEAALNGSEAETLILLRDLHPLGTINRKGEDSLSDFVKEGLEAAKTDVLRRMNEVDQSADSKGTLLKVTAYYKKLLERL
jgi:hypothetical protein